MAKEKVLVTGGCGFIGHNLVLKLVEDGYDVLVVDNLAGGDIRPRVEKVDYNYLDIANQVNTNRLQRLCEGVSRVFHLAALPRVQYSFEFPIETAQANVMGTIAILYAAHKAGAKKFVFASSSSVYGDSEQFPLHEDLPTEPMSPYALHKKQGEEWCRHFSLFYNLPTVCLRFFNVYGPGADPNGAYALVVAKFLEQKRRGEPLTITGDGEQTRDFTHVRDVVRGIILAAESEEACMGEAINLGGGKQVSVNKVAELIGGPTIHIDPRIEPHDTLASIEKAKHLLNWSPEISFEDGIAELKTLNHL